MLSIKINKTLLDNPFINASGCYCKDSSELNLLINSNSSSIITKTCTPDIRKGNAEPRYYHNNELSINSMGLPNNGLKYYLSYFSKYGINNNENNEHNEHNQDKMTILKDKKLKLISLGGLSLNDNLEMLKDCLLYYYSDLSNFNGIEVNFSCPNLIGHPQLGYDFDNLEHYLSKLLELLIQFENKHKKNEKLLFGIKLPPYFDISHFKTVANIINKYPRINFITCINSVGNGLVIDTNREEVIIKPKNGFGGIGGSVIKSTALANVHKFYELLRDSVFIIGCGGIVNGEDAFQHILCGASMISIGTQLMKDGPNVFERIENELLNIMKSKGYKTINDFKGKLKYIE